MAIIDKKGRLHGKLGKLNYRVLPGDIEVVQTLPRSMHQTRATKESALEFGLASNSAGILRQAFSTFTSMADRRIINRLNGTVLRAIKGSRTKERGNRDLHDGDLDVLKGFQFNMNSPLDKVLPVRPECILTGDQRINITVPAFRWTELKKADHTSVARIRMMILIVNFKEGYYKYLDHSDFEVSSNGENALNWAPDVQIPKGCIAMVSLSLNCYYASRDTGEQLLMNSTVFNPAEIIGAYSIPAEDDIKEEKVHGARSISGYKGSSVMQSIADLRKKDESYSEDIHKKFTVKAPEKPFIPTDKVFFKKE